MTDPGSANPYEVAVDVQTSEVSSRWWVTAGLTTVGLLISLRGLKVFLTAWRWSGLTNPDAAGTPIGTEQTLMLLALDQPSVSRSPRSRQTPWLARLEKEG
ncbi:MAG: hypothetical protein AB8G99_07385 [Planctomycetaceae bacterium]